MFPKMFQRIYYRTRYDCLAFVTLEGSHALEAAAQFMRSYGQPGTGARIVRIEPEPSYRPFAPWA
jgi:hypothetical protein